MCGELAARGVKSVATPGSDAAAAGGRTAGLIVAVVLALLGLGVWKAIELGVALFR